MRTSDQLGYPAAVLLIDRASGRQYKATVLAAGEECNPEHLGACCHLGDQARPRYMIDGVERPDFDPTIPEDLFAAGWYWHGGWLVYYDTPYPAGAGVAVGMPRESLAEVWADARKIQAERVRFMEARRIDTERQAARQPKPKKPKKAPEPAPIASVVVATPTSTTVQQIEQATLF